MGVSGGAEVEPEIDVAAGLRLTQLLGKNLTIRLVVEKVSEHRGDPALL